MSARTTTFGLPLYHNGDKLLVCHHIITTVAFGLPKKIKKTKNVNYLAKCNKKFDWKCNLAKINQIHNCIFQKNPFPQ
jgi:hypothetical protein